MSDECCNNRQNFGHPDCGLGVFSNIVKPIFVPLRDANGDPTAYNLNDFNFSTIEADFIKQDPADRLFSFPILENFVWSQADSLTEETSSGSKFFLREGVVSVMGELFKKDATPTMKGKIAGIRCAEWGVFFVTNNNEVIGASKSVATNLITKFEEDYFIPIPISSESVNGIFSPTQDASSQKIMFSFDLDRNFDTSTLYMIEGDKMMEAGVPAPFNFLDTPTIVDCKLDIVNTPATTGFEIAISDDYRQGFRPFGVNGNITGLLVSDFKITDISTGLVVPLITVVESPIGVYTTTHAALSSGTSVKVELALGSSDPTYSGQITYLIP